MKVLASLFRVVFSIIVLLALACYLQSAPAISLSKFCLSIDPAQLVQLLSGFNSITVSLVVILLLGILPFTRVLEAAWNVLFCAAVIAMLAWGLYAIGGPGVALPHALYNNEAVIHCCESALALHVPLAIIALVFIAGWLCASACGRVAITAVVSFGLWYGLTEFFTYLVHQWAQEADPGMPETLHMVQASPWIIAAIPGSFFLIYALLMAFFETFISPARTTAPKQPADEKKETTSENKAREPQSAEAEKQPRPDAPDAPEEKAAPVQEAAAKVAPQSHPAKDTTAEQKEKAEQQAPAPESKEADPSQPQTPEVEKETAPIEEKGKEAPVTKTAGNESESK